MCKNSRVKTISHYNKFSFWRDDTNRISIENRSISACQNMVKGTVRDPVGMSSYGSARESVPPRDALHQLTVECSYGALWWRTLELVPFSTFLFLLGTGRAVFRTFYLSAWDKTRIIISRGWQQSWGGETESGSSVRMSRNVRVPTTAAIWQRLCQLLKSCGCSKVNIDVIPSLSLSFFRIVGSLASPCFWRNGARRRETATAGRRTTLIVPYRYHSRAHNTSTIREMETCGTWVQGASAVIDN